MQRVFRIVLGAVTAFSCTAAIASARPNVVLKLNGTVAQRASDGTVHAVPLEKVSVKPGERITWSILATNSGDSAAAHLIPQGRIPAGTAFVAGTAVAPPGDHVEYSLDNGKTWSANPTVVVKTPAGPQTRNADPATFTQIRWVSEHALAPKGIERFA